MMTAPQQPAEAEAEGEAETPIIPSPFTTLSDDIVLNILAKLESDPRDWARICCVSPRFSSLVRATCYPSKCSHSFPSLVSHLLPNPFPEWASLYKLSVCCPGLLHAGILLENSDFGLEREIGPDQQTYPMITQTSTCTSSSSPSAPSSNPHCWSLFDDLYFDTMYDSSEALLPNCTLTTHDQAVTVGEEGRRKRKRKRLWVGPLTSHLASGPWNLSREQGNKLLASRFRGDSLYISDWPGCVHDGERRKYMVFRGVFKNFKRSRVWRTIRDEKRGKIRLECAFCACDDTWDLHSAFCLKRVFGFHDDGEPVVRAYVCENGHVSGAWTERPMMWIGDINHPCGNPSDESEDEPIEDAEEDDGLIGDSSPMTYPPSSSSSPPRLSPRSPLRVQDAVVLLCRKLDACRRSNVQLESHLAGVGQRMTDLEGYLSRLRAKQARTSRRLIRAKNVTSGSDDTPAATTSV